MTAANMPYPFADLAPPYSTIVADPPWGYEGRSKPWYSGSEPSYSLMLLDDIKALPVLDLAAPDAHLYLWAVLPMVPEAYEVVDAWGFSAETVLTWCKPGVGLGAGHRGNTELLIVARRGCSPYINPTCRRCRKRARGAMKCSCGVPLWTYEGLPCDNPRRPFVGDGEGSWFVAPRQGHSQKPALFGDLIERMSPGPYVELFARAPRLGWDSWGHGYEIGAAS